MPNHVTNWVHIKGTPEAIAELVARLATPPPEGEKEGYIFDFNAVIPMPESLMIESGSNTSMGLIAYGKNDPDKYSMSFEFYRACSWFPKRYPNVNTPAELLAFLKASDDPQHAEMLQLGKIAAANIDKYGYSTWYNWCIANWGTKWNSYDATLLRQGDDHVAYQFDTAWSSPTPIFEKLVEEGFEVNVFWSDEGGPTGEFGDPWEFFEINTRPTVTLI